MIDSKKALAMWEAGANDYEIGKALGKDAQLIFAWRKRRNLKARTKPGGRKKRQNRVSNPQPKKTLMPVYPNTAACLKCVYWEVISSNDDGFTGFCQYILKECRKRPCPPGRECTVRMDAAERGRNR
ncbi:MAG: hypothetical protein IJT94_15505 [Oscillibacter sp.]|nr:hypothetical protein [Oscillibacter sp.]